MGKHRPILTHLGEKSVPLQQPTEYLIFTTILPGTLIITRTGDGRALTYRYLHSMNEAAPRILIVEDEAIIAAEIEMTLTRMGYRIAGKVRNGDLALDLLASSHPDLALLDINIKGSRSGIDLANIIRQKHDYPFVFLTAFADRETLSKVKETLPYGYVVKPFNDNDLLSAIELALHKYATEQGPALPSRETINQHLSFGLSSREYDVLRLLHEGLSYREVGERLHLGLNTIKTYQKALFAKASISSRHQLNAWVKTLSP